MRTGILAAIMAVLMLGSLAFAVGEGELFLRSPANNFIINATNNSITFTFEWNSTTNASADATLYIDSAARGTINLFNGSNTIFNITSNQSFTDGVKKWTIRVVNASSNNESTNRTITIDTIAPFQPRHVDSIDNNTPDDGAWNTATGNIQLYGMHRGDDRFNDRMNLTLMFNGTANSTFNIGNFTAVNVTIEGLSTGTYTYFWRAHDNATNLYDSDTRTLYIDSTKPTVTFNRNVNITDGTHLFPSVRYTAVDFTNISSCFARVYNPGGETLLSPFFGTHNQTGNQTALKNVICEVNLTPSASSVNYDGVITAEFGSNDTQGNSNAQFNLTNLTYVRLYTGWNMIQADRNVSALVVSGYSSKITHVSMWNNSERRFITYTVGTPTNENATFFDGDGMFVRVSENILMVRNWTTNCVNCGGTNGRNITINGTLNLVSSYNNSLTLGEICAEAYNVNNGIFNSLPTLNVSSVSVYRANETKYYSTRCSVGWTFNENITVSKGQSYWLNMNASSALSGGYMRRRP